MLIIHGRLGTFNIIFLHRSRKRQPADEPDEEICDEEDEYSSSDDESVASSDDDDDDQLSNCEVDRTRTAKPTVHSRYYWTSGDRRSGQNCFQSVDGRGIFHDWGSGYQLSREAGTILSKGQKSLLAKQDSHNITLEPTFRRKTKLTQVPYRK